MLQVTFRIHLQTHLHEQHFTASEHSKCSLSASSVVEGLLLISQHIQKALSYSSRAESTQPLSLVCGLRHTQLSAF